MALSSQKMNLDYIRTFVILGQSSNMTEASKKLGVNVSYVSRHIKQLEDELGVRLTIPSPKNKDLQLTENGKFFLKNCGFFNENTPYRSKFTRPAQGEQPQIDLKALETIEKKK